MISQYWLCTYCTNTGAICHQMVSQEWNDKLLTGKCGKWCLNGQHLHIFQRIQEPHGNLMKSSPTWPSHYAKVLQTGLKALLAAHCSQPAPGQIVFSQVVGTKRPQQLLADCNSFRCSSRGAAGVVRATHPLPFLMAATPTFRVWNRAAGGRVLNLPAQATLTLERIRVKPVSDSKVGIKTRSFKTNMWLLLAAPQPNIEISNYMYL